MPGVLFGRRIRVIVGDLVVCDLDPRVPEAVNDARNLDVSFSTQSHTKQEPLVTELTIFGLNKLTRDRLSAANDEARRTAWQRYQAVQVGDVLVTDDPLPGAPLPDTGPIALFSQQDLPFDEFLAAQNAPAQATQTVAEVEASLVSQGMTVRIEAGYDDDRGLLAVAQILPDGLDHERQAGGGWVTTIRAQDSRLPWANAFVSEEIAPGVALEDMNTALRLSEQVLSGEIGLAEFQGQYPDLIEQVDNAGYENGRVLHGSTRDENARLVQTLGLRGPFLINGQPTFVSANTTIFGEAVVLQDPGEDINGMVRAPGGLLRYKSMARGYYNVTTLLNYRLVAGRQVQLLDQAGMPIGGGLFRVDVATHTGSSFEQTYYSECVLRPVTVAQENNA